MRIVVIGPGALGCLFAGLLSKKAEVWLLDKNPQRAARIMRNQGIHCEGASGKWQAKIPVVTNAGEIGAADIVLVCVKSYDTKDAVLSVKKIIGKNTVVVTLQNGLGNAEVISEVVGQENILIGVTYHGSMNLGDGNIMHTGLGQTVIGSLEKATPVSARKVREIFNNARIDTKVSRDITGVAWSKLIINVSINAVSTITRLKNGQLLESAVTSDIIQGAAAEAVKIAKKKRIKLIYDDPLAKVEAVCKATANNASSMLQDIMAKKKTEIDYLNGVIVRHGKSVGVPTPINTLLYNLVKSIESNYKHSLFK